VEKDLVICDNCGLQSLRLIQKEGTWKEIFIRDYREYTPNTTLAFKKTAHICPQCFKEFLETYPGWEKWFMDK